MTVYQNMTAIIYLAYAAMVPLSLVTAFAAVCGDSALEIFFTGLCGLVAAFVAVLAADSARLESVRIYKRRVR